MHKIWILIHIVGATCFWNSAALSDESKKIDTYVDSPAAFHALQLANESITINVDAIDVEFICFARCNAEFNGLVRSEIFKLFAEMHDAVKHSPEYVDRERTMYYVIYSGQHDSGDALFRDSRKFVEAAKASAVEIIDVNLLLAVDPGLPCDRLTYYFGVDRRLIGISIAYKDLYQRSLESVEQKEKNSLNIKRCTTLSLPVIQ